MPDFSLGITPYDKARGHTKTQIEGRVFHSEKKRNKISCSIDFRKNVLRYIVTNENEEYLEYGDWLGAPRQERFFTEPRIILRQIVSGKPPGIYAGYSKEKLYFTQIGFGIIPKQKSELKYFLALLNSKLLNFYHKYRFLIRKRNFFKSIYR